MPPSYCDFEIYRKAFDLAMQLFYLTQKFPSEERYALTDSIRWASRLVAIHLAEGWTLKENEKRFQKHLASARLSCRELEVWLRFAWECSYLDNASYENVLARCEEIAASCRSLSPTPRVGKSLG